jgi:hypothetical protein
MQKRYWTRRFKTDNRLKQKDLTRQIKDLLAKKVKTHHSAKSAIRAKHSEIEKAYHTKGQGYNWTEAKKRVPWEKEKKRGRPLGSGGTRFELPVLPSVTDDEVIVHEPKAPETITPSTSVRGLITGPSIADIDIHPAEYTIGREPNLILRPSTRMVPVARPLIAAPVPPVTRPMIAAPVVQTPVVIAPSPSPNKPRSLTPTPIAPVTRPPKMISAPSRQIGPGPVHVPQIGPHIRGLLPAAGHTTRLKLQNLVKKLMD